VIFVVNPLGVVEEEKTLNVLLELVLAGKKIFLGLTAKTVLTRSTWRESRTSSVSAFSKKQVIGKYWATFRLSR